MRLFAGVQLPEHTRDALVRACDAIRAADTSWTAEKWVPAHNLHLTLAFLGDVPDGCVTSLPRAIGEAMAGVRAFELPFARLSPVPKPRRTTMLWASYDDPDGACSALASAVRAAAADCGIQTEDRAFKAHVTLVRARRPVHASAELLAALSAAQSGVTGFMSVRSATLFSSTLTKAGPRYAALETWDFPA